MTNLSKNILEGLIFFSLIAIFAILYWQTIMVLPLFGDATIHGAYAKELLHNGWNTLTADYPPFYYYIMANFYSILGEKGFNFVPYVGFLFLLLSVFLFIRQVTKNYYVSLLAVVLVGASPKIIYYSARMYQEILIAGFFMFCTYLLFVYLERREIKDLFLLSIFTGITIALKQQGLFILYLSLILFFVVNFFRRQISLVRLFAIVVVPLVVAVPFYGVLFHTKGEIQPGSGEFKAFKLINTVGRKIFFFHPSSSDLHQTEINYNFFIPEVFAQTVIQKQAGLDNALQDIDKKYDVIAYSRAESRHIWPQDVLLNFDKFNQANNLYLLSWQGEKLPSPFLFYTLFSLLLLGFVYCLIHVRKYSHLILYTVIFLCINYILFVRNNDQQRYHIFIPIFLLVFSCLILVKIVERITISFSVKNIASMIIALLVFFPIVVSYVQLNTLWGNTQLYSPSIGGIQSVKETGQWFEKNTNASTIVGQQCGNETHYYTDREVRGDWRIYFLDLPTLKRYFKSQDISYYVINKSQLVADKDWRHICWVPNSFYQTIQTNYKKVYESSFKDIYVYKIT